MRPRERYANEGPTQFGDAELLALVLGTGTAHRSALEIAAGLLSRYGDLSAVSRAQPSELVGQDGIGTARAIRLHAALHAGRRSLRTRPNPAPVVSPDDAFGLLGPGLRGLECEELHALYLDRRRHPVAQRALTRGSDAYTVVDPRQVFRPAVQLGASAVIIAHNHPSGDPSPSHQDREGTRRVHRAGQILGVPLLDHLVGAGVRYTSLAETDGLLDGWCRG